MEEDGIQALACKFPRIENGTARNDSSNNNTKIGSSINEENGDLVRKRSGGGGGGSGDGSSHRFHGWHHHSSRIIRVSRASGGKDRHSKVMTSKGLRDRRVRLSVTTAIQFYDLQDRLGYDQPSKAVEWLIKAASDAISELPSLNNTFPETPKQPSDEKRGAEKCGIGSADAEEDGEASLHHHHHHHQNQSQNQSQNLSLSKSACSSTSETSKGSGGLSLSRSEIRVKARERARERAAKEKEKENDESCNNNNNNNNNIAHHPHNNNTVISMAQTSSFTELLTGVPAATTSPTGSGHHHHHHHRSDEVDLFSKGARHQWGIAPMDYFGAGILGGSSSTSASRTGQHHHQSSGFSGQIQLGNNLAHAMSVAPPFVVQSENQHSDQLQHFSFISDHLMPAGVVTSSSSASQAPSGGGGGSSEYNLNFTISSSNSGGLAGFNSRGTLQSNSPSLLPHLQRFSPLDGSSNLPFFIGAAAAAAPAMENHHHHQHHQQHQFSSELDGRLQLCYGDGSRHSDQKGKGKN